MCDFGTALASTLQIGVSPTSLDVRAICSDGNYNKAFGGVVIETVAVRGVELLRLFSFLKIWNYSNIINPMWFCMMY